MSREERLFQILFYLQLSIITGLVIFLTFRLVLTDHFDKKIWYLMILSSAVCASVLGFVWQAFASSYTSTTLRATFWISPVLTCAFGVLFVYIGTPGGLAASIIVIIFSIVQSLYACWANPRFEHTSKVLIASVAYRPKNLQITIFVYVLGGTCYSLILMSGIGGATANGTMFDALFILLILGSLAWTLQTIKNVMMVIVSHNKYIFFRHAIVVDMREVTKGYSMGTLCMASIVVPVLSVVRGLARGVSLITGDVDEFMFSCANCCFEIGAKVVAYGNRWGFVHVGVHSKGIVQASTDTWERFKAAGMEELINSDLTSSFCFLCGVAVGCICGLVVGIMAVVTHKTYVTQVSIYAFLNGYFVSRVAMAWIQASVVGYYVAYAENPESQQFDRTIPDYMQHLQRLQA